MNDITPASAATVRGDGGDQTNGACAIEVRGVEKRFGGVTALGGVDVEVPRGRLSALIGPNGAGKSSLFNVITGHMAPDVGSVRVFGQDVTGKPMWQLARMGVARTFQTPRGFASMTVLENLVVASRDRRDSLFQSFLPRRASERRIVVRATEVLEQIGMADLAQRRYSELSAGQMHVLEIGRQLMRDITVLLLDEPTAGVVPSAQERLGELLSELCRSGLTVLLVEHNLRFVFSLATNVAVMVNGCVVRSGTPAEIQHDEAVIDAYLGRSGESSA